MGLIRIFKGRKLIYITKDEYKERCSLYGDSYWDGDYLKLIDGNLVVGPMFGVFHGGKIAMFFDRIKYSLKKI